MGSLFGGTAQSAQQEIYTGIQVSTSLLGGCIPYIAGRQRIPFNLIWYSDFQVHTSNADGGKGGGSSSNKQYSYSASFIAGLCIGPIQGVFQIWHDKALVTLSFENLALALGSGGQSVWSGYPSGTPADQQIPYDHISYVASSSYNLGSSAAMPNLAFEVEGVVPGYSDTDSIFDADPSAVFSDYLLDSVHGALAGYPGTPLTIGSTDSPLTGAADSYQAYCMAMGLLTSPYEDTQRQATDFITELLQCTNSDCRLSVGTLEIIPLADSAVSATVAGTLFSYTPDLTPEFEFDEDDYFPENGNPPVELKQTPQSETYNTVNVEYLDRSNYYNTASVNCSDLNDIALYGARLATTLTWHQVTQAAVAKTAGTLWLAQQLYEINSYTFRVRSDYCLLEPLDYIALNITSPNLALVGQVCQITEIEEDDNHVMTITARELPGVTRTTAQYNWAASAGYFANYATDPGAVQEPAIFVMPPVAGALSEGITVGIAVCGQTSNAAWLGCDVYCSIDGGTTYDFVGKVPEAARYGTLTAGISAVADPDTTSTLSVALANTNLQLSTSVTHADADAVQTMLLVGSGATAEVMSYGTGSLASAGHYNLTYLRRGLYGSTDQSHSSGALFARLDGAIFQIAFDPGMAGQTASFKFVSFNTWSNYGPQTLSGATAYSYTIPSNTAVSGVNTLIPRGTCSVSADGASVYKATGSNAWDSDAYSPQGFLNGCFVSARGADTVTAHMVGLSSNPTSTVSYTKLNFALYQASGTLFVYESGTSIASYGSYAVGDSLEIRYDGVTVRYFHNGALIRAVRAPGLKLYPALCQNSVGSVVSGIAFGPASAVNQPTGSWLNTYPWVIGSTGSQGNYTDEAAVSAGAIRLSIGPYGTSEPVWICTGNGLSVINGGWDNNGDLYGIDSSKTYRSVVWVLWNGISSTTQIYHGPSSPGTDYTCTVNTQTPVVNPYYFSFVPHGTIAPNKWYLSVGILHGSSYSGGSTGVSGLYDPVTGQQIVAGTEFNILAGAPYQMQRVYQYTANNAGDVVLFAKPRFDEVNGNEPSLQALMAPAAALQGFVTTGQCVVTGPTMAKQGGSAGWDSCVYSVHGYTTAHVGGKPNSTSDAAMIGFAKNPSLSSSFTNGQYLWYNNSGTWQIYESGSLIASYGSVSTTDLPEITYDGSTIVYLLNGVSQRTVSVSGLMLYAFIPFYTVGAGWNQVNFGPTPIAGFIDTAQLGQNAATNLYTLRVAGPNTYNAGTVPVGPSYYGAVSIAPLDSDSLLRATLTFDSSQATGGSSSQVFLDLDWGAGSQASDIPSVTQSATTRFVVQQEFSSLPAFVASTLTIRISSSGSAVITIENSTLLVEVVKR